MQGFAPRDRGADGRLLPQIPINKPAYRPANLRLDTWQSPAAYPGFCSARLCNTSTAPTDIRHQPNHSGGWRTFRGPASVPLVMAKIEAVVPEDCPVRSARN